MKAKNIAVIVLGAALVLGGCGGGKGDCEHAWSAWAEETAPTCTEEGTEKRSCQKCGREERQQIPAAGHKWGTWQEGKAPTCTQKGIQERECSVCHEKESKEVEALGHAEGVWASDNEGHWKKCPVCEEALTEKEPHTAEGGTCTVCGGEVLGLEYAVYETECHVIGIGTEAGDIVIPATYCGKPVTEIAESAFSYEAVTSVIIPNSVVYIRRTAFYQCSSLRRVELGNSVKEIGEQAFNWDRALFEVELNASLEKIGKSAFGHCAFTEIELPSSLRSIGEDAFYSAAIQSVTVPGSVTEWGAYVFDQCKSLQSVIFEKGIKEIPEDACYGCSALTDVSLPEGLETIGDTAFGNCRVLSEIAIPASVRTIGDGAFEYSGLSDIVIPDTVKSLGGAAFYNCKSLVSAVVGDGVASLGEIGQMSAVGTFEGCALLTDMTIGSGVRSIAQRTFRGCEKLASIKFRGSTDAWKLIEKESKMDTWQPTAKIGGFWSSVLAEVVCGNGTLMGEEIG